MLSNMQHQTQTYICINVIFLCNRCIENIKVFENFLSDFKNYGKKISNPPGQNPDIPNATV